MALNAMSISSIVFRPASAAADIRWRNCLAAWQNSRMIKTSCAIMDYSFSWIAIHAKVDTGAMS